MINLTNINWYPDSYIKIRLFNYLKSYCSKQKDDFKQ